MPRAATAPVEVKELTIEEVAASVLAAIRKVKLDRDDLITLIVQRSSVRAKNGYGTVKLTRSQVSGCLDALEEVGTKYSR